MKRVGGEKNARVKVALFKERLNNHAKEDEAKKRRIDKNTMFCIFLGCQTFAKVSMVAKPSSSV